MSFKFRSDIQEPASILVKVGSNVVAEEDKQLNHKCMQEIVADLAQLHQAGKQIVLVSSASIACGSAHLNVENKKGIDYYQAASSIGQAILTRQYQEYFNAYDIKIAQILLTHDDFKSRRRFLNLKNTIRMLLENRIIPVINENDAVSIIEITVGDNDQLAAMTSQLIPVDLLLMISSTDGLYTSNPEDEGARKIELIEDLAELENIRTNDQSSLGRGGMTSKVAALCKLFQLGIPGIISGKNFDHPVARALGEKVGTLFKPAAHSISERKAWLVSTAKNDCSIEVDAGCTTALLKNSSLLPGGIIGVQGQFQRGDCVKISHQGKVLAKGLVEYDSNEVQQIKGQRSDAIKDVLGYYLRDEVIHRDNLFLEEK